MNASLTQQEYFQIFFPALFQSPLLEIFAGKMETNLTCSQVGNDAIATIRINETVLNITKSASIQVPAIVNANEIFFSLKDLQNDKSCLLGPLLNDTQVRFYPVVPALKVEGQEPVSGHDQGEIDLYMVLFYCLLAFVFIGCVILALCLARRKKRRNAFIQKFRTVLGQRDSDTYVTGNDQRNPVADIIAPLSKRASTVPSVMAVAKAQDFEIESSESSSSFYTGNEPSIRSEENLKTSVSMNSFHTASPGTITTDSFKTAESFTNDSDVEEDIPDVEFDTKSEQEIEVDGLSIVTIETVKAGRKGRI